MMKWHVRFVNNKNESNKSCDRKPYILIKVRIKSMNKSKPEKKLVGLKSQNFYKKNNDNWSKGDISTSNTKPNSYKRPSNSIVLLDGTKFSKMSTSNWESIKATNLWTEWGNPSLTKKKIKPDDCLSSKIPSLEPFYGVSFVSLLLILLLLIFSTY